MLTDTQLQALMGSISPEQAEQLCALLKNQAKTDQPNAAPTTAPASPAQAVNAEQLQKLLNQPFVQKGIRVVSDPEFQNSIQAMLQNPNRVNLAYFELGFILFIAITRSWAISKTSTWQQRLAISMGSMIISIATLSVVAPAIVFGNDFWKMLESAIRVLKSTQ